MKLVCLSDTHCSLKELIDNDLIPNGDVLVHAGDLTYTGSVDQIKNEFIQLNRLKNKFSHIILIAGNHDWLFQKRPDRAKELCDEYGIIYLQDSGITIDGVNFWGSPWQKEFCNWAFNLPQDELKFYWNLIPNNTQVLITHSPPYMIGDYCQNGNVGCPDLLQKIKDLDIKIHVYGHIHDGYGIRKVFNTTFINASVMNDFYNPVNLPIVVEL